MRFSKSSPRPQIRHSFWCMFILRVFCYHGPIGPLCLYRIHWHELHGNHFFQEMCWRKGGPGATRVFKAAIEVYRWRGFVGRYMECLGQHHFTVQECLILKIMCKKIPVCYFAISDIVNLPPRNVSPVTMSVRTRRVRLMGQRPRPWISSFTKMILKLHNIVNSWGNKSVKICGTIITPFFFFFVSRSIRSICINSADMIKYIELHVAVLSSKHVSIQEFRHSYWTEYNFSPFDKNWQLLFYNSHAFVWKKLSVITLIIHIFAHSLTQ